jgi:serine/threonine-protein kinase
MSASSDRNLLYGILALQMDFISGEQLIEAMHAWVLHKSTPLGELLCQQGALLVQDRHLLEQVVNRHLDKHGNDVQQSLAAVGAVDSVRHDLEQIADADVQASVAQVGTTPVAAGEIPKTQDGSSSTPAVRYQKVRPHARGGLGEVFVAVDQEVQREVALKEIQERFADHADAQARFLREAQVTGRLEHPGIVPVYGLGVYPDGRPFYAMRFVRGDSLQEAIARFHEADRPGRDVGERALEMRKLLGRFLDVCNAVAYAHSRGVLHRDIKPANVMLGQYGETLVVDWGLARALAIEAEGTVAQESLGLASVGEAVATQMGRFVGTPAFASPEQAAGRLDQLGPASDVYSLGAMLYCLLTGQAPFAAGALEVVLQRVQNGEFPPPRQVKRSVPAALEAICLKAMAREPAERYATARALAEDVQRWLADEPVSAWREPLGVRAGR